MPRNHDREFKLDLCRRIAAGKITRSQASRDHTLSHGMLDRWIKQYQALGKNAFRGEPWRTTDLSDKKRIEKLEEKVHQLRLENEKLLRLVNQLAFQPSRSRRYKSAVERAIEATKLGQGEDA